MPKYNPGKVGLHTVPEPSTSNWSVAGHCQP